MSEDKDSPFRIQNKRLHLTYKSHIPFDAWLSWFKSVKGKVISFYSMVHENSDEHHPYEHTHIALEFPKTFQTRNARFFDWECPDNTVIHPHIQPIKTKKHWDNCLNYHYKEATPFTNVQRPSNEIKEVWKNDSLKEALLNTCVTLKNVGGVIAAFNCKPSDYGIEPEVDWNSWQKDLVVELDDKPDSRKIIWYYDLLGGSGKSFFAKHFGMYRGAFVSTKANTYHIATQLDEFIKANGQNSILVVIFNFTRQQESHRIYQALEELKDGMVTTEKYKGKTLFFPHPHLVCFANYLPDIESVTKDRWDIRILQDNKIVKRYCNEKTTVYYDKIDPLISYKLTNLDQTYPIKEHKVPAFNINGGNIRVASLPGEVASLPQVKPPSSVSLQGKSLAPRENMKGKWIDSVFHSETPVKNTSEAILRYNNTSFKGCWVDNRFYPSDI